MKIWKDFAPFELEVLTPVHIGSGSNFSPLEYVVRQMGESRYEAWLIDTTAWLAVNHGLPEIASALDAGNMAALRSLLNKGETGAFALARIRIASAELGQELMRKRSTIDNQADIMSFCRNPFTHLPYLPASSVKGAISTAIIDHLNSRREPSQGLRSATNRREYQKIMEEMFGKISSHAMQGLRMADIATGPGATSIMSATGFGLEAKSPLPKTACEALEPSSAAGAGLFGNLRLNEINGEPGLAFPDGSRLTEQKLGQICNAFYKQRFLAEYDKFYTKPHFGATAQALTPVRERIARLDEDREILLRIGHYSHIECVTVSGSPEPTKKGFGTTRTIAGNGQPFGWVILKKCSMAEYTAGLAKIDEAFKKEAAQLREETERQTKLQQEAEAQAAKEAEAERAREEALAAMSPEEREIWQLEQPDADENQASALYAKLDGLAEQQKAAEALKQFYQRIGKWQGKQLSKRQKEKVAKLRTILGE